MLLKEKTKYFNIFLNESVSTDRYADYNFIVKNNFSYGLDYGDYVLNSRRKIK